MKRFIGLIYFVVFMGSTLALQGRTTIERLTASSDTPEKDDNKVVEREAPKARLRLRRDGLKRHSLGIGIGQTILVGDFRKHGDDDITRIPEFYYNYSVSHSFDVLLNFHSSKHTDEVYPTYTRLTSLSLGIKGRLFQFDEFAPVAIAGFGFYVPKIHKRLNDETMVSSSSKVTFGHHFGFGGELALNDSFGLAFIGHYHDPYDVKHKFQHGGSVQNMEVEGSYINLVLTVFRIF